MNELLAFINALNWQFIVLCLVLFGGLNILMISTMISRANKRQDRLRHQEQMEQKRIDAARAIVPIKPRPSEDY